MTSSIQKRTLRKIAIAASLAFLAVSINMSAASASTNVAAQATSITFKNTFYGFSVTLPSTWKNYFVVNSKWRGYNSPAVHAVTSGPMISLRSPLWTAKKPRQDIPIMILSTHQWSALMKENFHIGAAPIPPSELGHNSKYVFALPARYNFAFPAGYQEVEKILAGKPLKAFEKSASAKL